MFNVNGPALLSWKAKICTTCIAVAALCCLVGAQVQHASAHVPALKYDLKTEKKIKGVVQEVKQVGEGKQALMHVMIKTDTATLEVYLCPQQFLKDMQIELKSGDEVEVTGSPVKDNGTDIVLAREVVKGSDTYVLRDDKGVPVWNWQHT